MHLYIVCFDISDDLNRTRAGKRLLRQGERVQESVFELMVKSTIEIEAVREDLLDLVDEGDDLRFYRLCQSCREHSMNHEGSKIAEYPAAIIV